MTTFKEIEEHFNLPLEEIPEYEVREYLLGIINKQEKFDTPEDLAKAFKVEVSPAGLRGYIVEGFTSGVLARKFQTLLNEKGYDAQPPYKRGGNVYVVKFK